MTVPDYKVGDLVILKPELWTDHVVRVGVITELLFSSEFQSDVRSFLVLFNNAHHLIKNRIIWHNDVQEHYPVVK